MPDVQNYGDRRPYAVPDTLAELTGPASGHIVLPPELGWTGRIDYDLDNPSDAAVLYERVLVDAVRTQDMNRLINASRLRMLWSRLFLPARVRQLWESRFPGLGPRRLTQAAPPMDPLHQRPARVALARTSSYGFCLAGGYAVGPRDVAHPPRTMGPGEITDVRTPRPARLQRRSAGRTGGRSDAFMTRVTTRRPECAARTGGLLLDAVRDDH